ncbi:hypothetical protein O181_080980 [Austropuccinia psidii MF-1]|uniref:Uncharacterized protein n=1 Tax=Austropuccinia psidii MF-1 TaxID=1389203 RepID=A0A9Q3FP77_9BASI|nr:hypothetical protein [Austropuccinia psidii MF-1]
MAISSPQAKIPLDISNEDNIVQHEIPHYHSLHKISYTFHHAPPSPMFSHQPSPDQGPLQKEESCLAGSTGDNTHINSHPSTPSQAPTPGLIMANQLSDLKAQPPAIWIQTPEIATPPVTNLTSKSSPQQSSEYSIL